MNVAVALTVVSFLAATPTPDAPRRATHTTKGSTGAARAASSSAIPLSFNEFFEASPRELKRSQKLLSLHDKRVRMVGYMARMEKTLLGSFYLVPRPVVCDEEGAGTSDLPVENVLVLVRSARNRGIEFIPRPLEVTGILDVGNREEEDGRVSAIRLTLDGPAARRRAAATITKTAITKRGEQ